MPVCDRTFRYNRFSFRRVACSVWRDKVTQVLRHPLNGNLVVAASLTNADVDVWLQFAQRFFYRCSEPVRITGKI